MGNAGRAGLGLTVVLVMGFTGVVEAVAAPPVNDDFRDAKLIRALPFEHRVNTRDATTESGDPSCRGRGHTVWYSFTAETSGWLMADTADSFFDTTLSAYTGTRRRNLTQVACNDDSGPRTSSRIFLEAASGTTYHFMVSSYRRSSGGILHFHLDSSQPPCFGTLPTIAGTAGDDTIEGTPGRDVIAALEGNDIISGNGGGDLICGAEGDDSIELRGRADGGDGNDTITANVTGSSTLLGGNGDDDLRGGFSDDVLNGGAGDDRLRGEGEADLLVDPVGANDLGGGVGDDVLIPGRGTGVVEGGGGFDFLAYQRIDVNGVTVNLESGTAVVEGTFTQAVARVEYVIGSNGADTFTGGPQRDFFEGIRGADSMAGGGGDDVLIGTGGRNDIDGSAGDDQLYGLGGNDTIAGSEGDDELFGAGGNDQLDGAAGDDFLSGGNGDDELDGGSDADGLHGGSGTDACLNGETLVACEP